MHPLRAVSWLLVAVLLARDVQSTTCTSSTTTRVGTELWTDPTDACSNGTRLHHYTQTEWNMVQVQVGEEEQNCKNVTRLVDTEEERNVTTYEYQNVTTLTYKEVCVREETYECGTTTVQCGTQVCGWQGCCLCTKYCTTTLYCTRCAETATVTESKTELQLVPINTTETFVVQRNITTRECDIVPVFEWQNQTSTTTHPSNCITTLYETT